MKVSIITEDYIGAPGEEVYLVFEENNKELIYCINIPEENFEITVQYKDSDFIDHILNYNYEV